MMAAPDLTSMAGGCTNKQEIYTKGHLKLWNMN